MMLITAPIPSRKNTTPKLMPRKIAKNPKNTTNPALPRIKTPVQMRPDISLAFRYSLILFSPLLNLSV